MALYCSKLMALLLLCIGACCTEASRVLQAPRNPGVSIPLAAGIGSRTRLHSQPEVPALRLFRQATSAAGVQAERGVKAGPAAAGAEGSSSAALQVLVDPSVLADPSQPPAEIQLELPSPTTSGNSADSALQTQTVTATHRPDVHAPGVWVGQLAGFEGPLSVVTLVQQSGPSAVVYGDVLYVDRDAGVVHSCKIAPVLRAASTGYMAESAQKQQQQQALRAPMIHSIVSYHAPDRPQIEPQRLPNHQTLENTKNSDHSRKLQDSASATSISSSSSGSSSRTMHDPDTGRWQHDLLVVYTPAAAEAAGGTDAIKAAAAMAVGKANKAYGDSGVNVQLHLLDVRQVIYVEPTPDPSHSANQILNDLSSDKIPEINKWRNELGADLVTLFNNDNTTCGLGWTYNIQASVGFNADTAPFAIVMSGCYNGLVLTHEIGHNQGCGHLWENEHDIGDVQPYAYGYKRCDMGAGNFQDIMAASKCSETEAPVQIGLFSSPKLSYNNVTVGDRQRADCARALNESAAIIARFRDPKCPPGKWFCDTSQSCIDVEGCCSNADCGMVGDGLVYCSAPGRRCSACPTGTKACGQKCIPAAQCCADPDDCGGKGAPGGMSCPQTGGSCTVLPQTTCPDGQRLCGQGANSEFISEETCCVSDGGTTGCPSGMICKASGGDCTCPDGYKHCDSAGVPNATCIPDNTCCLGDPSSCPAGLQCPASGQQCKCPVGQRLCGSSCIRNDTCCTSDPIPCPVNGTVCAASGEQCKCASGGVRCGSRCLMPGRCCSTADCRQEYGMYSVCKRASGVCAVQCPRTRKLCNGSCIPLSAVCRARPSGG